MKLSRLQLKTISLAIISVLSLSLFNIASPSKAFAANDIGQGIQISPIRIELNAEKGKTYNLQIKVTNVTSGDLILKPEVNDFRAKDEVGTPEIIFDESDNATYSLQKWIVLPKEFALKSKETKTVQVAVNLPADAEAGGHYGVVRFSGRAPGLADTGVSLAASVGTLVLTRVGGDIKEDLKLAEYFTAHGTKKSGFFETSPITFAERFQNAGTVHVKPQGSIEIRNMFGQSVSSLDINKEKDRNVLPGSIGRFEQTLNKSWMIGKYTAEMSVSYGTTGGLVQNTISFWVIPYKLILAALSLLVVIFFVLRSSLRRYNKKIIAKHSKK